MVRKLSIIREIFKGDHYVLAECRGQLVPSQSNIILVIKAFKAIMGKAFTSSAFI